MARQAGDPVIFGDSADEDVLRGLGLDKASALVVSFSDPSTALAIIRAVRRLLAEIRAAGAEGAFTAVRRNGILGREPDNEMRLRDGDIVVTSGLPEALEHAEAVLLAG